MYTVSKHEDHKKFEKSPGFLIQNTGIISSDISLTYIKLENQRDPAEKQKAIQINEGYHGIYVITEGEITFTFYLQENQERVILQKKEYVSITSGTMYDIEGSGEIFFLLKDYY